MKKLIKSKPALVIFAAIICCFLICTTILELNGQKGSFSLFREFIGTLIVVYWLGFHPEKNDGDDDVDIDSEDAGTALG